jgi:hypothetical protein
MKRASKILFRIIFLMAVLFSAGLNTYSNSDIHTTISDHPVMENCGDNNFFQDVDFFDDEQINQNSDFFSGADFLYQIHIPQNCILIPNYPTSVWQPPKNK